MEKNPSSSRPDRKTTERNRRNHMKDLFSQLNSLIPHQRSRESVSLSEQLDEATNYIKKLQIKLEKMKQKKENIIANNKQLNKRSSGGGGTAMGLRSPEIEIHEMGSALGVVLTTGLDRHQFMFNQTVRVLHEEGAEIVNASFSVTDDTVFHSIHSKLGDSAPSYEAARIAERLKKFVEDANNAL